MDKPQVVILSARVIGSKKSIAGLGVFQQLRWASNVEEAVGTVRLCVISLVA